MRRLLTVIVLLTGCLAGAEPLAALAQDGTDPPTRLWEQYPLDETAPAVPPDTGQRPADVPQERAADGGDGVPVAALVAGGLLLSLLAALTASLLARRRPGRTLAESDPAPVRDLDEPEPPVIFAAPNTARTERSRARGSQALGYTIAAADGRAERARLRKDARSIQAACEERELMLGKLVRDVAERDGAAERRPGLDYALGRLEAREYGSLVVTSLERLAPTADELGSLIRALNQCGARLVVADIGLDTGTAEGRVAAEALVTIGPGGHEKGSPAVSDPPALDRRIVAMRDSGMTLQAIADLLNAEQVPTEHGGGEWRSWSVQAAGRARPRKRGA